MSATAAEPRRPLPIAQGLGQKGPQHDLCGEDVLLSKQGILFLEYSLDGLGIQNISEWQALALHKRCGHHVKLALVTG